MNSKKSKIVILAFVMSLSLSACSLWPGGSIEDNDQWGMSGDVSVPKNIKENLENQNQIKKFSDYDELAEFLEESENSTYLDYGTKNMAMDGLGMEVQEMAMDMLAAPTMRKSESNDMGGGQSASDFSETNIQVEGVDEADIIKNDGKYVYAVVSNSLYIIDAYPAKEAEVLAKIEFKSRPQDIYINGDSLTVFGRNDRISEVDIYKTFRRRYNYTFFKVFDISDKKNPKQVRDLNFEGSYSNSRMIGDYVYFVTNYYNYYYSPTDPIIPRVLEDGEELAQKCSSDVKCFVPEVYYFDLPYDSYNFTNVTAINVSDNSEEIKGEAYMLSSAQNMYVSQNNLYITYTKYVSEQELVMEVARELLFPRLSEKNQQRIEEIEAVSKYILNKSEKINKISRIIERYQMSLSEEEKVELEEELDKKIKEKYISLAQELEKTVIHKVAINKGELEYQTYGEVPGRVLNQFSMDEQGNYFRIATTKNRTWSRYIEDEEEKESYSNLYVLNGDLETVGSVERLAKGERIYSVRFMQDRAYMVTFKQTDPLFVIDLKNPTNPQVLGELKIPGFSNYLHPYDENHLIGIGKETKETEWGGATTLGIKLSLFDVSDVTKPKEVDTYVMGDAGSGSIALNDHKAFLFSKEKELLVMPVSIRESIDGRSWGKLSFSGAAVFKVTTDGFELRGKIDHSDGGREGVRDCFWGYCYYNNNVLRSLYMDDTLYTFSNKYLKMNSLNDLKQVNTLEIKKEKVQDDDDFMIIN